METKKTQVKNKKGFITREEALIILKKYRKYFNKEIQNYLEALVELEISIFSDTSFMDEFYMLDDIYEIVKYSIYNRVNSRLRNVEGIEQNNLFISVHNESMFAYYKMLEEYEDNSFNIFEALLARKNEFSNEPKKPSIILLNSFNSLDIKIAEINSSILEIEGKDYDALAKIANSGKIKFLFHDIVTPTQLKENDKYELLRLKEELMELETKNNKKQDIVHTLDDVLSDEFCLTESMGKGVYMKKYPWIDIKKSFR